MVVYWLICLGIVRGLCVTEVRRESVGQHEVQESGFRKIWLMRTWYGPLGERFGIFALVAKIQNFNGPTGIWC